MNRTNIFCMLIAVATALTFIACKDTDGTSVVPRFDKITCDPELPAPGDSITLTAHQSVHGKLIYSATYKWSVTYFNDVVGRDTTEYLPLQEVVYDYIGGPDPQIGFRIPAMTSSQQLRVHINASYGLSGQTELGQIYGQASYTGNIKLAQ